MVGSFSANQPSTCVMRILWQNMSLWSASCVLRFCSGTCKPEILVCLQKVLENLSYLNKLNTVFEEKNPVCVSVCTSCRRKGFSLFSSSDRSSPSSHSFIPVCSTHACRVVMAAVLTLSCRGTQTYPSSPHSQGWDTVPRSTCFHLLMPLRIYFTLHVMCRF